MDQTASPRPLTVHVEAACRMTGIGGTKFCELVQEDEIEVIKVGTLSSCRWLRSKPYRISIHPVRTA